MALGMDLATSIIRTRRSGHEWVTNPHYRARINRLDSYYANRGWAEGSAFQRRMWSRTERRDIPPTYIGRYHTLEEPKVLRDSTAARAAPSPSRPMLAPEPSATKPRSDGLGVEDAHVGAIMDLCAQGELLVSAGTDGRARLWDMPSWALLGELRHDVPETRAVNSAEFVGSSRLLTACDDQRAYLWQLDRDNGVLRPPGDHSCLEVVSGHHWLVMAARASPTDPDLVATVGFDGGVRLWRIGVGPKRSLRDAGGENDPSFHSACWSADGRYLWAGDGVGRVTCWDIVTRAIAEECRMHAGAVTDCQCSPSGQMAFASSNEVLVRDNVTAQRTSWRVEGVDHIWRARWLDDEELVIVTSAGDVAWHTADGQRLAAAQTGREAWGLAVLAGGRVVVGTRDGALLAVDRPG